MARNAGTSEENNFVKGMVTEFSGLNYPENSCSDALNCFFTKEGRVKRRLGIDFEDDYTLIPYTLTDATVVNTFYWQNVAGNSTSAFIVSQIGSVLEFFAVQGTESVSGNSNPTYQVNMNTHKTSGAPALDTEHCQFASGNGRLYVSHPYCQPFYVYYDEDDDDMYTDEITIKMRDFIIIDDGEDKADKEITDKNKKAEYNLYNQGWTDKYLDAWQTDNSDPTWPAKSHLWWYFRIPAGVEEPDTAIKGLDFKEGRRNRFSTAGNSFAPRGHIILNAFYQDRDAQLDNEGIYPLVTSGYQRPSCLAFMNSRIFYGGTNADKYSNIIYFSNIIRDLDSPIRFHQNGDPTSEISYELLPNDGGNIVIPEAGRIIFMKQVADTLMVIATNGVWSIAGSEGVGFTATDYSVNKISDFGALSHTSVTFAEGTPIWWNSEGIWTLTSDQGVVSLSRTTIQSYFDDIPLTCKLNAKGAYNPISQELIWVYSNDNTKPFVYNRALVFNTATGAFYPYAFPTTAKIRDIVTISGLTTSVSTETVVDNNGATVTNAALATVTVDVETAVTRETTVKFFTHSGSNITFSELANAGYVDWEATGNDSEYSSYFITAFKLKGGGNRRFQSPYITIYTENVTNASCYFRGIWDFANNTSSGLYTNSQQIYGPNQYRTFSYRRLRIRGNGMALQMKFTSDGVKPFTIIGWATFDQVDQNV